MPGRVASTVVVFALSFASACSDQASARYQTRGLLRAREGTGEELLLAIQHEPIAGFRDRDGKPTNMPSMTMLFGLASGLSASSLRDGDKLAITFEVHWDTRPTLVISTLSVLPGQTSLTLGEH